MNTVKVENCKTLFIGRRGENEVTEVVFDFSAWQEQFGTGVIDLYVKRNLDVDAYPVVLSVDGTVATWLVTAADTDVVGNGKIEFVYTVDQKVAKSAVFPFFVGEDIGESSPEPPEHYQSWLEQLTELGAETQANAQAAAQSASEAAESVVSAEEDAQIASTSASAAVESAESADANAKLAIQSAESADSDAKSAAQSASDAADSSASAESNARAAAQSASDATGSSASAEASAQAAAQSESNAEAWAIGERGGNPVSAGDPTYQNSAKYWAENARDAALVKSVNSKTGVVELDLDDIPDGSTYARATPAQLAQISKNADDIADIDKMIPGTTSESNNLINLSFLNNRFSSYRSSAAQDVIDAGKQDKITAYGILKRDRSGNISAAVAGADYVSAEAFNVMRPAATTEDIGKALIVKTVAGGKPTSYEYGEAGGGGSALNAGDGIDITEDVISNTQGIEYIVGTQTAATAKWTGVSTDETLKVGKIIAYYLPYAGTSTAATLALTMGNGATTREISLQLKPGFSVTTNFPAGSIIILVYDGTYWRVNASYDTDTNTYTTGYCVTNGAVAAKTASCTFGYRGDANYFPCLFRFANTATDATLAITTYAPEAAPIYVNGARTSTTNTFGAGVILFLYYNGAYYCYNDGRFPILVDGAVTSVQEYAVGLSNSKQSIIIASGILKGDGAGGVSSATAGTDYATPQQVSAKYTKPADGIPSTDMTEAVQASLQKADTALQEVPDTYRTAADQDLIDDAQDADIDGLKSKLGLLKAQNILQAALVKGEYIKGSQPNGGTPVSSSGFTRTKTLLSGYGEKISIELTDSTYEFFVSYYGANGALDGTDYAGYSGYNSGLFVLPEQAVKFGISFRRVDRHALATADLIAISNALYFYGMTDISLSVPGKAADAKTTGDAISKTAFYYSEDKISFMNSYDAVIGEYDNLCTLYPEYITKNTITSGSFTNYEYVLTIGNYNSQSGQRGQDAEIAKPTILICAAIHGDENASALSLLGFVKAMCENTYSLNKIIDAAVFRVIPIVNPWGYSNRKRLNENSVNINRNFNTSDWTLTASGSDYSGAAAGDQPQTQVVQSWITAHNDAILFVDWHNSAYLNEISCLLGTNNTDNTKLKKAYLKAINKIIPWWIKGRGISASTNIFAYTGSPDPENPTTGLSVTYALEAGIGAALTLETSWNVNDSGQHSKISIGVGQEAFANMMLGFADFIDDTI